MKQRLLSAITNKQTNHDNFKHKVHVHKPMSRRQHKLEKISKSYNGMYMYNYTVY